MKPSFEEYKDRLGANASHTAALIFAAQEAFHLRDADDFDLSQKYWGPIQILHCRADEEVIASGARLLCAEEKQTRITGADILSQIAFGDSTKGERTGELLRRALEMERDCEVIKSLVYALGHTPNQKASSCLFALRSHVSAQIRLAVAYALPNYIDDPAAISALVALSGDDDADVRDWATFGLGSQIEADSPEIREALLERLSDQVDDVRGEAICGLARRGETRVIPALLKELESEDLGKLSEWSLLVEAAEESVAAAERSNDPAWVPLLVRIEETGLIDQARVQAAVKRCRLI